MGVPGPSLASAISAFGSEAARKLSALAIQGDPEDQLRAPLETLVKDLAELCGQSRDKVDLVGETSLATLKTRPDYAVSCSDTLVGFIEVKAPGKGADPRKFRGHDKDQWAKLSSLPNLLYTDGGTFSLWQNGELVGRVVSLEGEIRSAGSALVAPNELLNIFESFFSWAPATPTSPRELASTAARLCRLLRDEVAEQMVQGNRPLEGLAHDWRQLLFPDATDAEFSDHYAQAVTFGLLLARSQGISLDHGVEAAARTLSQKSPHSLIGAALRVLTDSMDSEDPRIVAPVATLSRVLGVVDWPTIAAGDVDAWLYFYEKFLAEYDNKLRKETGSYYTPVEVVTTMTRLVDEVLHDRLGMENGFADSKVTVVDPAVGTGTFLLAVIRFVATSVAEEQGAGAVPAAITDALQRIIGFEIQLGPFAVAQLRVLAELQELQVPTISPEKLRMFVTNTLDDPYVEMQGLGNWYEPIAQSRRDANRIKRDEPVWVVIGNPPYKSRSYSKGGWIEKGNPETLDAPPLKDFMPPSNWGVGAHVKHLYNPYVYFWRWATWKVFDNHPASDRGVICLITVDGFLGGPGFQRMRSYLREKSDAIWVIHCSPEKRLASTHTRIFEKVKEPICIVMAVRDGSTTADTPAPVYYRSLEKGHREQKFAELNQLSTRGAGWIEAPSGFREPFLPEGSGRWITYPKLDDLLRWSGSGVLAGRSWVVAPDTQTLEQRWDRLIQAEQSEKPRLLSEHTDRRIDTELSSGLDGSPESAPTGSLKNETGPPPEPIQIGYRSFDRQWLIPDKRLINRPSPNLWRMFSENQMYLTVLDNEIPGNGPAVTFTGLIPDHHHFKGSGAGRVYPLWLNSGASESNIVPRLLPFIEQRLGRKVSPEDLFAYLAAVLASPAFSIEFGDDLANSGTHIPLTANRDRFSSAVEIGKRVLWLHSYGQRFTDPTNGRPKKAPRLSQERAPKVVGNAPIPHAPEEMPDSLLYDSDSQILMVGSGKIENVTPRMREYQVSGVNILDRWFSHRQKSRNRTVMGDRRISDLLGIKSEFWRPQYTTELLDLLHVIGSLADLEGSQEELLHQIIQDSLISVDDLMKANVLPIPEGARKPPNAATPRGHEPLPLDGI